MSAGPPPRHEEGRAFGERGALAVYRLLLLLLPSDFRREHGAECAALFRRTLRDAQRRGGRLASLRAATHGCLGVLRGAGEEARGAWRGSTDSRSGATPARHLPASDDPMMLVHTLLREAPRAARRLLRAPAFSVPAALTLALAVGAISAIFTVADAVVLSPLPYPDSNRLVWLEHGSQVLDRETGLTMTAGFYVQYREGASLLESIAIHQATALNLTGDGGEPERVSALRATPSLTDVLGVPPRLGRWFTEQEGELGAPPVAVLSEGFWQRRYGGDPGVLGRTITLSDRTYEIVGVMPAGFTYPEWTHPDLWVVLQLGDSNIQVSGFNYGGVARLRAEATLDDLAAELDGLIGRLPERFPADAFGVPFIEEARPYSVPQRLKEAVVGPVGRTLWILLGAAAVVLLIACANVANLLLVRSEGRQREMAVRRALGAGRAEVPAVVLTESVLLALVGGAAGLALAFGGVRLLMTFGPQNLPRLEEVGIDATVAAFTAALSLVAGLACGSVPFVRRAPMSYGLHESGRRSTATRQGMRARHVLMGAQVALSLLLLVAAGLMARSFQHLLEADPGFSGESVLAVGVALPFSRYGNEEATSFHHRLLERVRAMPGFSSASATTCPPLAGGCWWDTVLVEGRVRAEGEIPPSVSRQRIADDYFETMGMPPLAGRVFEPSDHARPTRVVVVDERFAALYFPGEDPIGQRVWPGFLESTAEWYEVVGVVPHVVTTSLASPERRPQLYLPLTSHSTEGMPSPHGVHLLARTSTPPLDLVGAVRAAVAELDPGIPLGRITTLEEILERDRGPMAFTMVLILIAGLSALTLGLVGVYGVIAFGVSQRTGEIGIRLAMGARPADVARLVLRQGGVVAALGVVVGLGVALAASGLLESMLFDVSPTDPATYAAVALGLFLVSLAACWVPARRASRLDPVEALRNE